MSRKREKLLDGMMEISIKASIAARFPHHTNVLMVQNDPLTTKPAKRDIKCKTSSTNTARTGYSGTYP